MYKNEIIKDLKDVNYMIKEVIDNIIKSEISAKDARQLIKFAKTTHLRHEVLNKLTQTNIKIFNLGNIEFKKQMIALNQSSRTEINIDQDYFFEFMCENEKQALLITQKLDTLSVPNPLEINLDKKILMIPLHNKSKVMDKNKKIRNNCWDIEPCIIIFENDENGECIRIIHLDDQPNKEVEKIAAGSANFQRIIVLYALKLLTCKNINIKEEIIYKNKTITKKGKLKTIIIPSEIFYTLEIENINGQIMFCEGHFKTFTKEKPLFGKIVGTYWWQPQIKRSKKCIN